MSLPQVLSNSGTGSERIPGRAPKLIISLTNQKGGVGKTTTSLNLAAALAHVNTRPTANPADPAPILYVDTDPQQSGALEVQEAAAAATERIQKSKNPAVLTGRNIVTGEPLGLPFDFFPAPEMDDIDRVPDIVRQGGYRHAIVDTAGSFADLTRSVRAVQIADFALVPILAEKLSRVPAQRTIEAIVKPRLGDRFAVVIVNWPTSATVDLFETADWVTEQGYPLINTPIRSWRLVARNVICTIGPRSRPLLEAQADFLALATAVTQGA